MNALVRSASNYSTDFEDYEDDFDTYSDSSKNSERDSSAYQHESPRLSPIKLKGQFDSNVTFIHTDPQISSRVKKIKSMIAFEYASFELLNFTPMSSYELKLRGSLYAPISQQARLCEQETQTGDALVDASFQTNAIETRSVGVQHLEEAAICASLDNKRKKNVSHTIGDSLRFQIFMKASSLCCEKLMFERPREVDEILDSMKILSLKHIIPIPPDYRLTVIERSPVFANIISVAYHLQFESYIHLLHIQWPETPQHVLKCFGHVSCVCPFPTKAFSQCVFVGTTDGSFFIFDVRLSMCPIFACRPAFNDNLGHLTSILSMSICPPLVSTVDAEGYFIQWHMSTPSLECQPISKTLIEKNAKVMWLNGNDEVLHCGEKTVYHSSTNTYQWRLRWGHGRVLCVAFQNTQVLLGYDSGFIALFHTQKLGPLAQWYLGHERIIQLVFLQEPNLDPSTRLFYFISNKRICRCEFGSTYELDITRSEMLPENNQHMFLFDRLFLAENRRVLSVYQLG
ncbi:hypothetical protein HMI54_008453 [Coelomomyces lativittatus]|nr:hypothetical protein HMI54_008453 [Coelomomyces lativittatus]